MRAARLWPLAIVAVLGSTVAANVVLLIATRGDVSAIEPDYYRKAIAWDSTLAERRRSDALGWSAAATVGALDAQGGAEVAVRVADREGRAIHGARVRVTAIHNLDPGHPVPSALEETGEGRYAASLPLGRAGLWELRINAERAGERFEADLRADCAPRAVAATPPPAAASLR